MKYNREKTLWATTETMDILKLEQVITLIQEVKHNVFRVQKM